MAAMAGMLAAGCAPVYFTPGGLTVGAFGGSGYHFSQCSILGGSPEARRYGVDNAAIRSRVSQSLALQTMARMSFGVTSGPAVWKRIASGDC